MNLHRAFSFLACCALACAASASNAHAADRPAATPPPTTEKPAAASPAERAADLYKRATELYREGKLAEAERLYLEAWSLQRTYDIATNLGAVQLDLKKHRDAAEHLAFARRTFPARGNAEDRETIAKRLALAKSEIVTLRVKVNLDKADVSVNGQRVGIAPITDEVFVDAGSVTVEATLDGHEPAKQTFENKKGETREVSLVLVPKQPPPPPPGRSMVGPGIAFGAGGVGLVLGAITGGLAIAGKENLSKTCKPSGACPETARGEHETALTMSRVSTVGFVVAGVGAAVGTTLLLLPGKNGSPQTAVHVGPGFVGVKGVF